MGCISKDWMEESKEHLWALHHFSHYFFILPAAPGGGRLFITLLSGLCNTEPIRDCVLLLTVNKGLDMYLPTQIWEHPL